MINYFIAVTKLRISFFKEYWWVFVSFCVIVVVLAFIESRKK